MIGGQVWIRAMVFNSFRLGVSKIFPSKDDFYKVKMNGSVVEKIKRLNIDDDGVMSNLLVKRCRSSTTQAWCRQQFILFIFCNIYSYPVF